MKAGISLYPIRPGVILKLSTPYTVPNRKLGETLDHTLFVWVQKSIRRDIVRKRIVKNKERIIRCMFCYVPQKDGATIKTIERVRRVQFEYITKLLKERGYELVAENCNFYDKFQDYKRFYRRIGII